MSLVPRWFNRLPRPGRRQGGDLFGHLFEDVEQELGGLPAGLSISSDDKNIFVEAAVPGLTAQDVEVSVDNNNTLWIKGEKKEEARDKAKKFYHRSQTSFSYCIPLWEEIDMAVEPKAVCKDGIMKIVFAKKKEKQAEAKKIQVKDKE